MRRQPRVEIEPSLYRALRIQALISDKSPKDLVAKWILANLSPRAKEFVSPGTHAPLSRTELTLVEKFPRKFAKRLTQQQKDEIKMLDASGIRRADIARQFDVDRSTVTTICGKKQKKAQSIYPQDIIDQGKRIV